jgi:subtilase family serine protease
MEGSTALPVLVGLSGPHGFTLLGYGGTSAATPAFAAVQADAQQLAGHRLGFANPALYERHGSGAFHDVTDNPAAAGNRPPTALRDNGPTVPAEYRYLLFTLGHDFGLTATKGYDDATGLGSPAAGYLPSYRRP